MKFSQFKGGVAFILALVLIVPQTLLADNIAPSFTGVKLTGEIEPNVELSMLKASLQEDSTYLEYTKYKMLKNKIETESGTVSDSNYYSDYNIRPRGPSPLSREYTGVSLDFYNNYYGSGVTGGVDVITGGRAIDESLQLGSIAAAGRSNMTNEQAQQHQNLRAQLELYYNRNNYEYPESLSELPASQAYDIEDFSYQKINGTYNLSVNVSTVESVSIDEVEGLTIKHHPWTEMIGSANPEIPDIYNLIPDDYFFIHFNDLKGYRELEETINNIKGPLSGTYGIGDSLASQSRIFAKLGIVDNPDLDVFLDEVALVSYDFDGYPATDYALVLKTKSEKLDDFVSKHIKTSEDKKGRVGGYYVVATSNRLLEIIKDTESNEIDSMAESLDLKYSLSVLEEEKDGLAFISDSFVEKLTSPAYRIKAGRRNAVLQALETLQYSSFAYRDLEGEWPTSVRQMMDEKYFKNNTVFELDKYSIDNKGIVSHDDWGSVYAVTPINGVVIDKVLPSEKLRYDNFREGYQELWTEFIDPVAISILIGDQIRFHTIILPLIDDSEYNWIKNVVGDENEALDFIINPDRIPAIQLTSHFDVDNILYAVYKASPRDFSAVYQKCIDKAYDVRRNDKSDNSYDNYLESRNKCIDEVSDLPEEEAITSVKEIIAEWIQWEGDSSTLFDFIDNEVVIAASENATFLIEDLTNFDVYLGVELKDEASAKEFIDHLFSLIMREWFGGEVYDVGPFGVAAGQPIKNMYNGVEYYVLPTGFINVFYIFMDGRFYITVSQNTINALIDGEAEEWPQHMLRLQDYLSAAADVSLLLDGTKLDTWLNSYVKSQVMSEYLMVDNFETMENYLKEVELLGSYTSSDNGSFDYYTKIPTEWMEMAISKSSAGYTIASPTGSVLISGLLDGYDPYYSSRSFGNKDIDEKKALSDFEIIMQSVDLEKLIAEWSGISTFGADLSFTEHGLDIRVAFDNQARTNADNRVGTRDREAGSSDNDDFLIIFFSVLILVALLVIVVFLIKRTNKLNETKDSHDMYSPSIGESYVSQTESETDVQS